MDCIKITTLIELIFEKTFEINPTQNKRSAKSHFKAIFTRDQLNNAYNKIANMEPIFKPEGFADTIRDFFDTDEFEMDVRISKTNVLFDKLHFEKYLEDSTYAEIENKCDIDTLRIYRDILLDVWNHYYNEYLIYIGQSKNAATKKVYSIKREVIENILINFNQPTVNQPSSLEEIPKYVNKLRDIYGNETSYKYLEWIYENYFKKVIDEKKYVKYTQSKQKHFIEALYCVSDVLDKIDHKDAYKINLEILDFYYRYYKGNYRRATITELRRIQGCTYAIGIDNSEESIKGDMVLLKNSYIIKNPNTPTGISKKKKLEMCIDSLYAMRGHKLISEMDREMWDERIKINGKHKSGYLRLYERKLKEDPESITDDDIEKITVLTFIYSNIAACYMQYASNKLGTEQEIKRILESCEDYHDLNKYLRLLLLRCSIEKYGIGSKEHIESLDKLAALFNSIAGRCYYQGKYAYTIVLRAIRYNYYKYNRSLLVSEKKQGNNEMTQAEVKNMPVDQFIKAGGDSVAYNMVSENCFKDFKEILPYIVPENTAPLRELASFQEVLDLKKSYNDYVELKKLFE